MKRDEIGKWTLSIVYTEMSKKKFKVQRQLNERDKSEEPNKRVVRRTMLTSSADNATQ